MAINIGISIYLTNKELLSYGFSVNTIKEFEGIRDPEDQRYFIYDYDKVAGRSEKTRAKLPPKALIIAQLEADKAQKEADKVGLNTKNIASKLSKFYSIKDLTYFVQLGYSEDKAKKLAISMSVLRFLDNTRVPKAKLIEITGFSKREDLIKTVAELMKDETVQDGTEIILVREGMNLPEIPTNYQRLRTKVDEFAKFRVDKRKNECDFLIKKKNNNNRQIIGKPTGTDADNMLKGTNFNINEFHARTLMFLAMNPGNANKFDMVEIYARYCKSCAENGKTPVSLSRVKSFLAEEKIKDYITWERDGFSELDKRLPHVHGKKPKYSLAKGGIDGFQVDFLTEQTGKYVMLTAVAVFDYASEAITGFDVGFVETGLLVRNAYRNHLRLHGGRTFFEIDMDGGMANKAEKSKQMFSRLVTHVRVGMSDDPTGKHRSNSKERISERLIQEFNRLVQNMPEWKGTNVTSFSIWRKPNPDYAKQYIGTVNDGIAQIINLVNIYNNKPLDKYKGKSRIQIFNDMMDPEAEVIDYTTQAQLFNWSTVKAVVGDLIRITVNKVPYDYFVPDVLAWSPKMDSGRRVKVYYDEDDMKEVHVFGWELDENGNPVEVPLGSLKLGVRAYRDKRSQSDEDLAILEETAGKRKSMINQVKRKQYEVEAYQYGIDPSQYPNLKDLEKVIMGARDLNSLENLEERYSEELATVEAQRTESFYRDQFEDKGVFLPKAKDKEAEKSLIDKKFDKLKNIIDDFD
ncbi:MAG TPA: hypothetical protein VL947_14260 [Cytophagales bacterium]|nr:hypothetical protein [Cytophagales bacterium]